MTERSQDREKRLQTEDEIEMEIAHAVVAEVVQEDARAHKLHGPFNSLHEGYAALLEEVDELWDEIKKKKSKQEYHCLKSEAIQVAAMGMKMAIKIEIENRRRG